MNRVFRQTILAFSGLLLVFILSPNVPSVLLAQQGGIIYVGPDSLGITTLVYSINPDGSGNQPISPSNLVGLTSPTWSRDGLLIAAAGTRLGGSQSDVFTFDPAGASLQQVTNFGGAGITPEALWSAFSREGQRLAVDVWWATGPPDQRRQCVATIIFGTDGTVLATVSGVCNNTGTGNGLEGFGVGWSPTGDQLIVPVPWVESCFGFPVVVTEIWAEPAVNNGRNQARQVTRPCPPNLITQVFDVGPVFSPDGTQVAFVRWIQPFGSSVTTSIRIINLDGSNESELVAFPNEQSCGISWSPDGTQLLFDRSPSWFPSGTPTCGSKGLWMINSDGTSGSVPTPLPGTTNPAFQPSWAGRP